MHIHNQTYHLDQINFTRTRFFLNQRTKNVPVNIRMFDMEKL